MQNSTPEEAAFHLVEIAPGRINTQIDDYSRRMIFVGLNGNPGSEPKLRTGGCEDGRLLVMLVSVAHVGVVLLTHLLQRRLDCAGYRQAD